MANFVARKIFPRYLRNTLWGDREQWGLTVDANDPQWQEWQETYAEFYLANQREGIGTIVNDAGYSVMADINLNGKTVLEIGAGDIRHLKYWSHRTRPTKYFLADISLEMMRFSTERLKEQGISYETLMLQREQPLPLRSDSVDVIVSFYSLEHLYPLTPYLDEMLRVLKPGGILIGAIPAEGGLAWGLGRALTSRRWFKKNTTIDPDKIICWEHPNYADDILYELDARMERQRVSYWPLNALPLLDANLIIRYQYRRA
jgi:SAM-dependent methyltransferase